MIKVFNPYNSSSTNGSYFCMTLCVAIATAQERKIWFIQEAYLLYISWGTGSVLALHCGDRIEHLAQLHLFQHVWRKTKSEAIKAQATCL